MKETEGPETPPDLSAFVTCVSSLDVESVL
jgi:hypothetical protein